MKAMYSGCLKGFIPTGPGTFMKPDNNGEFTGEFMASKSNGLTRWSFGMNSKYYLDWSLI